MHYFIDQIAFKSEMRGPTFQCEATGEGFLRLHYFSHRQGLFPIVKGLVRQVSRLLFEMDVKLTVIERSQERRKSGMVEHVVFSLEPDEDHRAGKRFAYKFKRDTRSHGDAEEAEQSIPLAVTLHDFSTIFPYHICFNKQMVVEHVGRHLLVEYGVADKKMLKLSELVDVQQLTHKNIMTYLNTLFIFQLKHHCSRNEVEKGSSEAFVQPLSLKGQMMPVNDGNYIIFLCSPHVTTVRDFVNLKLYLSDMPMFDATRDLVMLNQKEYSECTVMFTDVPDFSTINGSCKPAQVMDIIATLFKQFDVLIEKYECNKVLSLLDSYLIVSGAPNVNTSHAVNILNLALGIIILLDEKDVRVGISCGSIVAGVVSHEKPRLTFLTVIYQRISKEYNH
ncbi:heme NO binding associated [Ostertagia ostertagi]